MDYPLSSLGRSNLHQESAPRGAGLDFVSYCEEEYPLGSTSGAGVGVAGLLHGVSPGDLPTFAGVTLVRTTVALAACYTAALRAMRLDPITTPTPNDFRLEPENS
jgi:hypothetical protein